MPAIRNFIQRHRPLITPRIEFLLAPRPALPLLTARMEFTLEDLRAPSPTGMDDDPSLAPADRQSPIDPTPGTDDDPESERASSPPPQPSSATPESTPTRIPKPNGEPGRPGSGGFNLEATLRDVHGWSKKDIDDLNAFVRKEATKTLNMNVCFRSQRKDLVNKICEQASEPEFWPVLANYEHCWPVRSALKLILKYKSEASRRSDYKGIASRLRRAMDGETKESSEEL